MTIINPKPEDDELYQLRQKINGNIINADDDALHLVIGRAITAWSNIEDGLFLCYLIASKPENVAVFTAAFHAVNITRTKLDMCNDALTFYLIGNDELYREWAEIIKKANDYLKIRNKIAHYKVVHYLRSGKEPLIALSPSMYKINQTIDRTDKTQAKLKEKKGNKLPRLTIKDIEAIAQQFNDLSPRISRFNMKLNPSGKLNIAHTLDYI